MRSTSTLARLIEAHLGAESAEDLLSVIEVAPELLHPTGETAARAVVAMALNVLLMKDLLARAPTGAAYVADQQRAARKIVFDHGAVRTILFEHGPTGELPPGEAAFARILEPLGYGCAAHYPLERLRMLGRAYTHLDLPEATPQFFVSELIVGRFSSTFQATAARVFGATKDPLDAQSQHLLDTLAKAKEAPFELVAAGLPGLAAAFARLHPLPSLGDYEILKAESAEAAWIATEGNAFNHVTDRVADVERLAEGQRALGRPMKDVVEISRSGRVRQTAFKADPVSRQLDSEDGAVTLRLPGSFYEFISRDRLADGRLDLTFDSGNAQGIFKMTDAEPVL